MRGRDLIAATLFGGAGGGSSGGGGGVVAVSPKEVNFYDYDGTCVYAYSVAEAQALSELPAGPAHDGLVFQGWNWSLEGVKGLTRTMNIGAMYTTDDGKTRLYITLQEGRTSPMLGVGVNGTVTVDWGDGTEPDVLTGTSTSTTKRTSNHAYAAPGDYVIRLTVDGEIAFTGDTSAYTNILTAYSYSNKLNTVYQNSLKKVEIGDNVTLSANALRYCRQLNTVSVAQDTVFSGNFTFANCLLLQCVVIPTKNVDVPASVANQCMTLGVVCLSERVQSVGNSCFSSCYALKTLEIPDNVVSIGENAMQNCWGLKTMLLHEGITSLPYQILYGCQTMKKLEVRGDVTEIGQGGAVQNCYSLSCAIFKGNVNQIKSSAFSQCYAMAFYDFTACTAVPTLDATSAFSGIPADCEIRVPAALYDEWIAATNWATYASQIVAY